MTQILENTRFHPEAPDSQGNPFFTIPTRKQVEMLNVSPDGFALSQDPSNRIVASMSQGSNILYEQEVPILDEANVQAFTKLDPGKMLIYRMAPDGPARAFLPKIAQAALSDKITGIERYGTFHAGTELQFNHAVYNGARGNVAHHEYHGLHLYKESAELHDDIGNISEYTQRNLLVNPFEDVLYINWASGEQMRIQTEMLGAEQGSAFHELYETPLPFK
jgi:hypothetical protein